MNKTIDTITAFVHTDETNQEGIIALCMDGTTWLPCVGADHDRIVSLYPRVKQSMEQQGKDFKLIQFSTRSDITDDIKKQFEDQTK